MKLGASDPLKQDLYAVFYSSLATYMDHASIRLFEEKDLDFAYEMNVREQWNDTKADIKRAFNYEPNGCFIAEVKGLRAAHVFTVNYGNLGWIGLLIVKPKYRKMEIATQLMKRAIDNLVHCGVKTVKLDAVPQIAGLYRKLGFIDEYDSLRLIEKPGRTVPHQSSRAVLIQNERISEIAEFDAECFGANRTKVLMSIHREFPKLCFVSYNASEVAGYIMCRKAKRGYKIGPFVCNPEEPQTARDLLAKCMQRIGSTVSLNHFSTSSCRSNMPSRLNRSLVYHASAHLITWLIRLKKTCA